MTFFQDMFNSHEIRFYIDGDDKLWVVAKDICNALGYKKHRSAIHNTKLQPGWKLFINKRTMKVSASTHIHISLNNQPKINTYFTSLGGALSQGTTPCNSSGGLSKSNSISHSSKDQLMIINEPAMYALILRRNSKTSNQFRDWVVSEVLTSIRQKGTYTSSTTQHYSMQPTIDNSFKVDKIKRCTECKLLRDNPMCFTKRKTVCNSCVEYNSATKRNTPEAKLKLCWDRANTKGWSFNLTLPYVQHLFTLPCRYCKQLETPPKTMGVDRDFSNGGYTIDNTSPCCWTCNRAKGRMTPAEFVNYIHHTSAICRSTFG